MFNDKVLALKVYFIHTEVYLTQVKWKIIQNEPFQLVTLRCTRGNFPIYDFWTPPLSILYMDHKVNTWI